MNRRSFMQQLSQLLSEIPQTEREEAIQYYNDYFDDAGVENESAVIEELGSPEKVAGTIKADLMGKASDDWEFTEAGCTNMGGRTKAEVIKVEKTANSEQSQQHNKYYDEYGNQYGKPYADRYGNQNSFNNGNYNDIGNPRTGTNRKGKMDIGKIIFITLIVIITSPLWISIGGAVLGVIVAVLATLVSLLFGFVLLTVGLLIGGIALFGFAIAKMFISPLLGFMTMGIALLLLGIGILALLACIWICGKAIPAVFRWSVDLCSRLFHRKQNRYDSNAGDNLTGADTNDTYGARKDAQGERGGQQI